MHIMTVGGGGGGGGGGRGEDDDDDYDAADDVCSLAVPSDPALRRAPLRDLQQQLQ